MNEMKLISNVFLIFNTISEEGESGVGDFEEAREAREGDGGRNEGQ